MLNAFPVSHSQGTYFKSSIDFDECLLIRASRNSFALSCLTNIALHPSLDREDVRLLHMYASKTSYTLSGWRTLDVWRSNIVQDAKSNIFLMHSILAITALHGCRGQSDQFRSFASAAEKHHQKALSSFRNSVMEVKSETSGAIVVFALLTAVYSLGLPITRSPSLGASPTFEFLDIILMMRKAWLALGTERKYVENGPLMILLKPFDTRLPEYLAPLTSAKYGLWTDDIVSRIGTLVINSDEPDEDKHVYAETAKSLLRFFLNLPKTSPLNIMLGWPMHWSDRFCQLMRERRPIALCYLAYYLTPMSQMPSLWTQRWAREVIKDIWDTLGESYHFFLEWPATRAGILDPLNHCGYCRCIDCYMDERAGEFVWKDGASALLVA